jgi:hypothetical protein
MHGCDESREGERRLHITSTAAALALGGLGTLALTLDGLGLGLESNGEVVGDGDTSLLRPGNVRGGWCGLGVEEVVQCLLVAGGASAEAQLEGVDHLGTGPRRPVDIGVLGLRNGLRYTLVGDADDDFVAVEDLLDEAHDGCDLACLERPGVGVAHRSIEPLEPVVEPRDEVAGVVQRDRGTLCVDQSSSHKGFGKVEEKVVAVRVGACRLLVLGGEPGRHKEVTELHPVRLHKGDVHGVGGIVAEGQEDLVDGESRC